MSTNLETPTNHALVGHIWPQTWKPQKNTYLCSFSSKGSSVRMPSLQTWEGNCHQVATKCVRQALTMYIILVENLIACVVNVYNCRWKVTTAYVRTSLPIHTIVIGLFFPSTQDCRYVYERRYSFPNNCPENCCRRVSHAFCFTFWLPLLALM